MALQKCYKFDAKSSGTEIPSKYVPENAKVIINLNGHTINRGLKEDQGDGHVILIASDAEVTINNGTITGGYSNDEGGGLYIKPSASVTLNDVNVTGNTLKGDDGTGIYMYGGATLTMNGGSISSNILQRGSSHEEFKHDFQFKDEKAGIKFVDCDFDKATFSNKDAFTFVGGTVSNSVASIFGEGSLTNILVIISLIASAVSISLTVFYNKKKAVPVAANGASESDDEE